MTMTTRKFIIRVSYDGIFEAESKEQAIEDAEATFYIRGYAPDSIEVIKELTSKV